MTLPTASQVLKQCLDASPPATVQETVDRVMISLQNSQSDWERSTKQEATDVLNIAIEQPALFVDIAKHIPTSWIDFLSGTESLWSKIITQMLEETLAEGANKASPVFSLVRRWTHHQSIHSVAENKDQRAQFYWETMKVVAHHPKGEEFATIVRATKGPVRQWMEDFHKIVGNRDQIDGVSVFETLLLNLPPTPASNILWVWRMDKTAYWYKDFPADQMRYSSLSPQSLVYALKKNVSGDLPVSMCKNIFSWKEPLKVIQEIKTQLLHSSERFMHNLTIDCLKFPLAENVWSELKKSPLEFFLTFDAPQHHDVLMKPFVVPEPRGLLKHKTSEHMLGFAIQLWEMAGKLEPMPADPWGRLTHVLDQCGLLPHVVLNSVEEIKSENIRWSALEELDPAVVGWSNFRPCASDISKVVAPPEVNDDEKRMVLMKMVQTDPLQYHTFIKIHPDFVPDQFTPKQSHMIVKTLCDNIKWDKSPVSEIQWMSNFLNDIKINGEVDVRSMLLSSFMGHHHQPSNMLATVLTEDSERSRVLQDVLRNSTNEIFPYTQPHERAFEQVVQKFLLMEAANYNAASSAPSKRKM